MVPALSRCLIGLLFICCPAIARDNHFSAVLKNTTGRDLLLVVHPGGKGSIHAYQADGKRDLETMEDQVYRLPRGSGALLDFVLSLSASNPTVDQTLSVMNDERTEYGSYQLEWKEQEKRSIARRLGTYSQSFVLTDPKAAPEGTRDDEANHWTLEVAKRKEEGKFPNTMMFRLDWNTHVKDLKYACFLSNSVKKGFMEFGAITKEGLPLPFGTSGSFGKPGGGVKISYATEKPGFLMLYVFQSKDPLEIPKNAFIQGFIVRRDGAGRMTLTPSRESTVSRKGELFLKEEKAFANLVFKVDSSDPERPVLTVNGK